MKNSNSRFIKPHLKVVALCGWSLLALSLFLTTAQAQAPGDWTSPFRLSTGLGAASPATLISDDYGYVHTFWSEALDDERMLLQYARFDGHSWSVPNDIYVTRPFAQIKNVAAALAPDGRLYLMWPEGDNGPVYFSSAPVHNALSAYDWEQPYRVALPTNFVKLQIDSKGIFHVLYSRILGEERGVYYVHSEDKGITWSRPLWLDPDIPPAMMPTNLEFVMDEAGGLHVTWYYFSVETFGAGADWVRYTHSLDGGKTWSLPFTIDKLEESELEAEEELSAADPVLAVQGENVHVIWAGGTLHYRHHRYSKDRGVTWEPAVRILGELNGQAGDGMAVDGAGRLHLFTQIRFPMGIYHAVWDQGQWSEPSLIYLIRYSDDDDPGDKIGAHNTRLAFRAGNQIVLTLADPPSEPVRRLFFMLRTLEDVPAAALEPTPAPTTTPLPQASTTPAPLETASAPLFNAGLADPISVPRPDNAVWIGIAPAGLVLLGLICFRLLFKLRR